MNGLDLHLEVFDYDAGSDDDFMGRTYIPVAAVQQVNTKIEYNCTANHYLGLLCTPNEKAPSKILWAIPIPIPVTPVNQAKPVECRYRLLCAVG